MAATGSPRAKNILDVWPASVSAFVKLAPPVIVDPTRAEKLEVAAEAKAAGAEPPVENGAVHANGEPAPNGNGNGKAISEPRPPVSSP